MSPPPLPSVSLIITTYNAPQYLRLALESALCQSVVQPHEIVVADDGSRDDVFLVTREIRKTTDVPVLHVWQPDEGFRLNRSRNNAIAVATGDYLVLLDGDCFVGPRFIEDHARAARPGRFVAATRTHLLPKRRDYVLKTGDRRVSLFTPDTTKRLHSMRSRLLSQITSKAGALDETLTMSERRGVAGANLGFWRSDAVKVNGFNEEFTGYGGDDIEFANRLIRAGVVRYKLEHLAVAYHFAHGDRIHETAEIDRKMANATVVDGCRAPNGLGLDRALNGGIEKIER